MKRILRVVAIVVVLLLVAVVALPFLINPNQFRPTLEAELTKALGREVKVGELKLSILSGGVTADSLSIADDPAFSRTPFVQTKALTLGVDLMPLIFSHKLQVNQLTLDQPRIDLLQSAAGDWNYSTLGVKSSPAKSQPGESPGGGGGGGMDISVKLVKITNGHLTFAQHSSNAQPRVLDNVNIEVRDFTAHSAFPFSLSAKLVGGGDLKLDGSAGPINSADASQTPAKVRVNLTSLDLAAAGAESAAGLSGVLSVNGAAAWNGRQMFLNGHFKGDHLKLTRNGQPAKEAVEFDFELIHDIHKNSGVLRKGDIHVGSAPASLTGTYVTQHDPPSVDLNLSGDASTAACGDATGIRRDAARRIFVSGWDCEREAVDRRPGGQTGDQRHAGHEQHQARGLRSGNQDVDHREAGRHQDGSGHRDSDFVGEHSAGAGGVDDSGHQAGGAGGWRPERRRHDQPQPGA